MSHTKIRVVLAEGWHGIESEGIWCEPISEHSFRVRNIPFYAFNISLGDIVTASLDEEDGRLWFTQVTKPSGHHVYRCIVKRDKPQNSTKHFDKINDMNCFYETAIHGDFELFTIDVPADVDVNAIYDILKIGESDGSWDFEEASYAG